MLTPSFTGRSLARFVERVGRWNRFGLESWRRKSMSRNLFRHGALTLVVSAFVILLHPTPFPYGGMAVAQAAQKAQPGLPGLPQPPANAVEKDAKVYGQNIHYMEAGSGPAVILLHGLGGDLTNWASTIG